MDVGFCFTKERDPAPENDGNSRDGEMLDQPCREKPLNGDSAIHIDMSHTAPIEPGQDFSQISRHALHDSSMWRGWQFVSAQHENGLLTIGPGVKGQDLLEGPATNNKRVD